MEDWFDMRVDPAQIAKERAKARELRRTNWWQAQIQKGVCHYCGGKFPPSELTMDHIVPLVLILCIVCSALAEKYSFS